MASWYDARFARVEITDLPKNHTHVLYKRSFLKKIVRHNELRSFLKLFVSARRVLYVSDEIKIPFCPKGVSPAFMDFDMKYDETSYVGIAQVFYALLNNIHPRIFCKSTMLYLNIFHVFSLFDYPCN